MKIHDEKYGTNALAKKIADRAAQEMQETRTGDYIPSERDSLCYIRDRYGIASLVVWLPWEGNLFIGTAWTRPDRRRQGLYRMLVEHLKGVAEANGLKGLALGVFPANTLSIATHERLGFKATTIYFELPLEAEANPAN